MRRFRRPATLLIVAATLLLALFLPTMVLAQAITAPPAPQAFDWTAVAINLVTGLQVLVVPLFVSGVRQLVPKIPRVALPFVALVIGVGTDGFATYVAGGGFSPLRGAIVGLVSVALREIVSTIREHGAGS